MSLLGYKNTRKNSLGDFDQPLLTDEDIQPEAPLILKSNIPNQDVKSKKTVDLEVGQDQISSLTQPKSGNDPPDENQDKSKQPQNTFTCGICYCDYNADTEDQDS